MTSPVIAKYLTQHFVLGIKSKKFAADGLSPALKYPSRAYLSIDAI